MLLAGPDRENGRRERINLPAGAASIKPLVRQLVAFERGVPDRLGKQAGKGTASVFGKLRHFWNALTFPAASFQTMLEVHLDRLVDS